MLLGVAAAAALLYGWRIRTSGFAPFYSVAAKSMSVSWKAFFYGALDPSATITIDKLAGSFAPQALSARIFGYHAWSLTLPQVVEGVIAVLVTYRIGRRWLGPEVGLLAAALFGLTPIVASMFGHPMEDGLLTMCLVLAADALQRAVLEARLASLVWAGVWIGVGFQAKMMQAWIVLPALVVTYLVAAPTSLRRRLSQLAIAGVVMLAVSLSWVALYTVTPAHDRPFVDGSTNNSAIAMVFGYNGLERFGVHIPGSVPSMFGGGGRRSTTTPSVVPSAGPTGNSRILAGPAQGVLGAEASAPAPTPNGSAAAALGMPGPGGPGGRDGGYTKLVTPRYASQVGWLYPLAVLSLAFGLVRRGRAARTDEMRGGFLLWGAWLVTFAVVFSKMMIPHMAYMSSLAPPLAMLSAGGIVLAWRSYRDRTARWALPVATAAQVAWTLYLSMRFPTFLPWLRWTVGIAAAVAVLALVAALAFRPVGGAVVRTRRIALTSAMAVAVAAMLAVPTVWASSVLDAKYSGSALDASAGPGSRDFGGRGPGTAIRNARPDSTADRSSAALRQRVETSGAHGGPGGLGGPGGFGMGSSTALNADQQHLYTYLDEHRDGARYLAAAESWNTVAPFILATGQEFLPMGGFSGTVPQPTLIGAQFLVESGQLRFFLLPASGSGGFGMGRHTAGPVTAIASWVKSTCTEVPAKTYGGTELPDGGASESAAASGVPTDPGQPAPSSRSAGADRHAATGAPMSPGGGPESPVSNAAGSGPGGFGGPGDFGGGSTLYRCASS